MGQVSGVDRFLMVLANARPLRARAEHIQKRRRFTRFWTKIEPTLREAHEREEHVFAEPRNP